MVLRFLFGAAVEIAEPVVVLRPVDEGDVALAEARPEIGFVHDAAVEPQIEAALLRLQGGIEEDVAAFQGDGIRHRPRQQLVGPGGRQLGEVVAPERVPEGLSMRRLEPGSWPSEKQTVKAWWLLGWAWSGA